MMVPKCDLCGEIIENEAYYGVRIDKVFKTEMTSIEMCEKCARAMLRGSLKIYPPKGSWIEVQTIDPKTGYSEFSGYKCEHCDAHVDHLSNYCPNCGTNMQE